jgi:two-component system, NarL family, sensor histidine kinase LiaS
VANGHAGPDGLEGLALSAERALSETRLAILELADRDNARLDVLLEALAQQVGTRYGRKVALDLQPVDLDDHRSRELARIAREGLTNAIRHSDAARLTLRLSATSESVRVIVQDNGVGLDPTPPRAGAFGLTSMRERAEQLGGTCSIVSHPGNGTIVAVEVPRP